MSQEENHRLRNFNQELEEQIKKLKEDKQSKDESFEKIQNNNNLLENKLVQIEKEASKLSGKQIQVEKEERNTNSVPVTVQKEVNPSEKQTTRTPYRHPIRKSILTNDRVKMNINREVMISDAKKHKIYNLNKKMKIYLARQPIFNFDESKYWMDNF